MNLPIFHRMPCPLSPDAFDLLVARDGRLEMQEVALADLAERYGTPLHVIDESRLERTAATADAEARAAYSGRTSVHFALKCNSVPAVAAAVRRAGLCAEVMSAFELEVALRAGWTGADLIANGPCKTPAFLRALLDAMCGLIVVDSLEELVRLDAMALAGGRRVDVLLRVNPDVVPRGMNSGSATASRRGSCLGLDLKGGEADAALDVLRQCPGLRFRGWHFHIGTGMREADAHARVIRLLAPLFRLTRLRGHSIDVLDVGGGVASPTAREFSTWELLRSQCLGFLPAFGPAPPPDLFARMARCTAAAVEEVFHGAPRPQLVFEPGRCIASAAQCLLLRVHALKQRPGAGTWAVTDGGLGTVSMPTYYEYHEVLLCGDAHRPCTNRVHIAGPGCFAADLVYRNKPMPRLHPGDVIAVMDSGAYFTALESNFGHPHPAIVAVHRGVARLVRRRENVADMLARDGVDRCTSPESRPTARTPEEESRHAVLSA
jgi:diaminopimelate decarboxylase